MALIHLHNGTFYTDDEMFDSGHGACCECGTAYDRSELMEKCRRCNLPLIFIRSKFIPKYDRLKYDLGDSTELKKHIVKQNIEIYSLKKSLARYKKIALTATVNGAEFIREDEVTIYPLDKTEGHEQQSN